MTAAEALDVQVAHGPSFASQLLSANDRGHWATKEDRRRYWLDLTTYSLRGWRGRAFSEPVHITVTLAWPDHRRRDVGNYAPTAKVLVDAAVRAGLLADDSDKYVTGPDLRRAYGPHEIRLTITPMEGAPA